MHTRLSVYKVECVDPFAPSTKRVTQPHSWHHNYKSDDLVRVVFCDVLLREAMLFLSL